MKFPNFLLFSGVFAAFLATGCGSAEKNAPAATSETLSLTGFPAGTHWPCQDYANATYYGRAGCMDLKYKPGSSHPDTEIAVDIRGFNDAQENKILAALDEFTKHWNDTHSYGDVTTSPFATCMRAKVKTELFAAQSSWPEAYRNIDTGINWALLNVQYLFEQHWEKKIPIIITPVTIPGIYGQAEVGTEGWQGGLGDMSLNTLSLDDPNHTGLTFAGTLLHEWLHRKGYLHPNTDMTSLVYVAGNCLRNGNNAGTFLFGVSEFMDD